MNHSNQVQHIYDQTGTHEVTLVVANEFGCLDTTVQTITILDDFIIYIPNTFTPNADGINDDFLPVISGYQDEGYELLIFDRWGHLIFSSAKVNTGWTGIGSNQKDVPQGVYPWTIKVITLQGATRTYSGHVNLIR